MSISGHFFVSATQTLPGAKAVLIGILALDKISIIEQGHMLVSVATIFRGIGVLLLFTLGWQYR